MPLLWFARSISLVALIVVLGLARCEAAGFWSAEPGSAAGDLESTRLLPTTSLAPLATADASPSSLIAPPDNSLDGWLHRAAYGTVELNDLEPSCDECPKRMLIAQVGYDTWRGISDGDWQNNGIHTGLNFGTRLGRVSDLNGVGFQLGATVGAYNWAGTDYRLSHLDQAQPQGFVTYGLFRHATETSPWTGALVQDWMLNSNYGVFAQNPTLGQWRGSLGYVVNPWNELGIWGTWRAHGDTRFIPGVGQTSWRPVNQFNVFWHYKWGPGQPDTWIWVGRPENDRLGGAGSLGDYLVGLLANAPLGDRVGLYALVTYMHQSAAAGPIGATEDAWNFTVGLSFYPARNSRTTTVAGQCWMPLMPVANNGYFLVDTNRTF
jgi:hypothetical protein